ncbi:MAG TPA: sugar transferase, partial [Gemmatimonadales bacterium]|nr:sugar transferase [Gemmatimonadales bacterium]
MHHRLQPGSDHLLVTRRSTEALVERTGGAAGSSVERERRLDAPVLAADRTFAARLTRVVNFVLAALALFLASPLLLLIALAIKLTSRGPVLYTQERVGLDRRLAGSRPNSRRTRDLGGQPFTIYKFRTMRVDAERESGAVWATQDDPRVTPVGRFLRQYRLDE